MSFEMELTMCPTWSTATSYMPAFTYFLETGKATGVLYPDNTTGGPTGNHHGFFKQHRGADASYLTAERIQALPNDNPPAVVRLVDRGGNHYVCISPRINGDTTWCAMTPTELLVGTSSTRTAPAGQLDPSLPRGAITLRPSRLICLAT
jgi:hypothetical protein